MRILYAIADELNGASEVPRALERMLEILAGLLRLRTGWIWLVDPETGRFYNAAAYNLPPYLREPVRMADSWCQCTQNFRDGTLSAHNVDVIECSRLAPAVQNDLKTQTGGLQYHASVPLHFRGRPLGIMNLAGPKWRRLSRTELRLLTNAALQAGAMIERARLADEGARLARVEERTRLAREIHDTLVQRLAAIALGLEGALQHLDAPERARHDLRRTLEVAREGIAEARGSMQALRGSPPAGRPLPQALEALARAFTSRTGIPAHVQAAGFDVPAAVETELLAIAREALENAAKHAAATRVQIRLGRRRGEARLQVRDNGAGYKRAMARAGGQGIVGMGERAALVGGTFSISGGRAGTTVTVLVPLQPPKSASIQARRS